MTTARLSSWLLLGGILTGFLGAVWSGHLASTYSKPDGFRRFHQRISPDALYYPPYAMLEQLAVARWQPGKTLVLIGGNSILNGVAQPVDEVWSLRLQSLLGDSYVVVNLAFRGAYPTQGAALVAESLLQRGYPVIFVANTNPTAGPGRTTEGASGYFYWQALYQDRLTAYAPREADIDRWLQSLPPGERRRQDESRLDGFLEARTRHQSLWHHVGYRHFFSVWNFVVADRPWAARTTLADNEPGSPPVEQRFQNNLGDEMALVRSFSASFATRGADGKLETDPGARQQLETGIEASIPPALRPHTLILMVENAPYYLARLTPEERERDAFVHAAFARIWREHGIACEVAGIGFEPADYHDRAHLAASGGEKLAGFVAEKILQFPSGQP